MQFLYCQGNGSENNEYTNTYIHIYIYIYIYIYNIIYKLYCLLFGSDSVTDTVWGPRQPYPNNINGFFPFQNIPKLPYPNPFRSGGYLRLSGLTVRIVIPT